MAKCVHTFEFLTPELRPQDPTLDGSTLKIETCEHGGEEPDCFPNAIKVTDTDGRWCVYVPITVTGRDVRSYGFGNE